MDTLILVLTLIMAAAGCYYFVVMTRYAFGWLRLKKPADAGERPAVSVIIAARNESRSIEKCLRSLSNQDYNGAWEAIVIDDHSEDDTYGIIRSFSASDKRFKVFSLPEGTSGKKAGIAFALQQCRGGIIITTDADCVAGPGWIRAVVSAFADPAVQMVAAPVMFHNDDSAFKKLQSLEMLAIMAVTGGSLSAGSAVMCNGANLAYRREAFDAVGGFSGIDDSPSGDDVLLLYKISRDWPGGLRFLKDKAAIVYTEAKENLAELLMQRRRWASKSWSVLNPPTRMLSVSVFLFSLLLLVVPLSGYFRLENQELRPVFLLICLILTCFKCFIDFLLLFLAASFFNRKKLLVAFLPAQIVYIIYVVVVGMLGSGGKFDWKGRRYN